MPAQDDESSSVGSDDSNDQRRAKNLISTSEDPRTISQIRRSRIDLDKRYVFLCPTSLSKHFAVLPHQAKDSALLVFRCSRSWVFKDPAIKLAERTKSRIDCGLAGKKKVNRGRTASPPKNMGAALYQSEFSREFLHWVLTKEKEGCVYWYKPDRDLKRLSAFFEEKIDPMNEHPYRPLLLDPHWWRVRFMPSTAKHTMNPSMVIAAITQGHDIDIPALQELIYQSNPTVEPIAKWPHAPSMRFLPRAPPAAKDFAGQQSAFRGYIDQELRLGGDLHGKSAFQDQSRIGRWPVPQRERQDDLYTSWARDDAVAQKSSLLQLGRACISAR
jgi:hypothetical protein